MKKVQPACFKIVIADCLNLFILLSYPKIGFKYLFYIPFFGCVQCSFKTDKSIIFIFFQQEVKKQSLFKNSNRSSIFSQGRIDFLYDTLELITKSFTKSHHPIKTPINLKETMLKDITDIFNLQLISLTDEEILQLEQYHESNPLNASGLRIGSVRKEDSSSTEVWYSKFL